MNDRMRVRREKMENLREEGIDPFGARFERDKIQKELHETTMKILKEELLEKQLARQSVAGRMMTKRGKGKLDLLICKTAKVKFKFMFVKDKKLEEPYAIFKRGDLGDFFGCNR